MEIEEQVINIQGVDVALFRSQRASKAFKYYH